MQREEKQLDMILEAILTRLNELKNSIGQMIHKVENEYNEINWPTFLDNFALISSHVSCSYRVRALSKVLIPAHRIDQDSLARNTAAVA